MLAVIFFSSINKDYLMKFKRSIISLALISALSACGGGSSSKAPIVEQPPAPVPVKTIIAGKAIKGTLANAVVTVYKYVDGQAVKLEGDDLETASIITEADGSYTITILDYDGPVKIELSVDETTTMVCDAPAGCGGVAYGETIALASVDPTLVLSAMSTVGTANNGEANVNVSALTHLAAALIEADAGGVSAETIQTQSSVIANAFNIIGSITELEPTTIDNATAVANEDNADELRYGLINAGIMAALFSGEEDASAVLSEKLAEVVEDLIEHDGTLLVNQDDADEGFELSIVDVLDGAGEAASAAAEAIAADPDLADNATIIEELEQQETNLENQSEYEEANEGEDGRSEPEVEVPTEGDAIAKAKAMVDDVRLFSHLFKVGTDSNTGIATEGDKYTALIGSAGSMVEAEAASFLLLADVADALSEISMMFEAGTIAEGTFPIDSFLSIDGAVGSITLDTETDNGGMLFTISATSDAEKVALNAAVVFAEDGLSLNFNLDGSIESAGAMLSLSEGSFAKVNLDSAISRESLEDDSFEGEVASGELSLEVILEQKASDTVTDPVAFTGIIKSKLVPVTVHTLDEKTIWARDENGDLFRNEDGSLVRDEDGKFPRKFDRYGKSTDVQILPEMLTLSGGFSSQEGNLIKATLTVNIQDLENYKAPEFEYIGAPVEDIIAVSISENKNTVTETTNESVINGYSATHTFTPGDVAGEWSSTVVRTMNEEQEYSNKFIFEDYINYTMTRSITKTNGMEGYIFTYHGTTQDAHNAYLEKITPKDEDGDNLADSYTYYYYSGQYIDEAGNLIDWNDEIVSITEETSNYQKEIDGINELMTRFRLQPNSISNAAENFAFMLNYYHSETQLELASGARASVFVDENEDKIVEISNGTSGALSGNITLNLPIENVFTITVNDDSNTVIAKDDTYTRTYGFDYSSASNFSFTRHVTSNMGDDYTDIRDFSTNDLNLDVEEVVIQRHASFGMDDEFYLLVRVTPIDENNDGLADYFTHSYTYSDYINDEGVLVDEDGVALEENPFYAFDTWDNAELHWQIPFNPFTTTNALEAYKQFLVNGKGSYLSTYIDGVGSVEAELSSDDINSIVIGSTTFDGINTHPDNNESLENKDVFLDASAALSLEAILGDYQVSLMLSGQRTALDDGKFDLEMSYKLPDDENMRKFIAHMKTDDEDTFTVNNSEGVLLIMSESNDSTSDVIGSIVVGSSATKVADIEDRNGVIWIVYTDTTEETL